MDKKDLRSLLAGLSLAALVGATGLAGCAATGASSSADADKPQAADTGEVNEDTTTA